MKNPVHKESDENQTIFSVTQKFAAIKIMHEESNSASFSFIDKYNFQVVYNSENGFRIHMKHSKIMPPCVFENDDKVLI